MTTPEFRRAAMVRLLELVKSAKAAQKQPPDVAADHQSSATPLDNAHFEMVTGWTEFQQARASRRRPKRR